MIVLLDTSEDLAVCAAEIGCNVGQLLTPLTRFRLRHPEIDWAMDNGAYSTFDERAFLSLLKREEHHKATCRFVAVPDVVGAAQRTREVFDKWKGRLSAWPLAFVCQDGQESLPIPWDEIAAIFIGGTTTWKLSGHAAAIVKTAKVYMGKWVHVGRVNDPGRFRHFEEMGADSIDGSGLAQYSHMRAAVSSRHEQPQGALWAA